MRVRQQNGSRRAPRSIPGQCSTGSAENTPYAALAIEDFDDIPHALVLLLVPALTLNLQKHFCAFDGRSDKCRRDSGEEAGNGEFRRAQTGGLAVRCRSKNDLLREIIRLI